MKKIIFHSLIWFTIVLGFYGCLVNAAGEKGTNPELDNTDPGASTSTSTTSTDTSTSSTDSGKPKCPNGCCGIRLNTDFPIIGNCIEINSEDENPTNAFPKMMGALTKIVMSLIMVVCFILIIVAGIMRAGNQPTEGKKLLKKVAITILLLGFSGVILRLINPNFFS